MYFKVNKGEKLTFLTLKEEIKELPTSRQHLMPEFLYNEEFAKRSAPVFEKVFGKPNTAELEMLKEIRYVFVFDSDYKIAYFRITYPTSAWEELPRWEEKLYRFGMTYEEIGVKSLTRWPEGEPFVRGEIYLQFRFLINYYCCPPFVESALSGYFADTKKTQ